MSEEELVDDELIKLREMKHKILARTIQLRKEFVAWEKAADKVTRKNEKNFLPEENEFQDLTMKNVEKTNCANPRWVAVTNFIMGAKFSDVDKKWLSDHNHVYTANVKTKALEFFLEVTVNSEDANKGTETLKIVCNFINLRQCFSMEISSWVQRFTEANDVSNLFSAVSDYSRQNVIRSRFLKHFQTSGTAFFEECNDNDGGVIMFLHAKDEADFVYFKIRWVLKFVDSIWQIDNCFTIYPISATDEFLEANNDLLENFCKCRMKENDLKILWNKLCLAIEQDESSASITGTHTS